MAKMYSGAKGADVPPTPMDAKMTDKHASQSVTYNMSHFTDHAMGAVTSLKRVKMVNPKKAKALANSAANQMDNLRGKVAAMAKGYK